MKISTEIKFRSVKRYSRELQLTLLQDNKVSIEIFGVDRIKFVQNFER